MEKVDDKLVYEIGKLPVEQFVQNGFSKILNATKIINTYPTGQARDLYCTYPTFNKVVDEQSNQILRIISKVMKHQEVKGNIERRQNDEQFEMLLECNDLMLERLNSNLDELDGIKKNPESIIPDINNSGPQHGRGAGSWNTKGFVRKHKMPLRHFPANQISKPQLKFKIPIDNRPDNPFIPKIKEKPYSLKPLAVLPEYDEYGNIESYLHPYEFELEKFEPMKCFLEKATPKLPNPLESTILCYVDTIDGLNSLLSELRLQKEIAVDVEHHSLRTFLGMTCLLQISSCEKDYIIDTLALRDELHVLNEIFANPNILKIFHGADHDIEWLQRDLSIYVVNMFDTHQAAKILNYPRLSLAYLLKHYCNVEANKSLQMADWRERPLPDVLIKYAREDTHYLIYIYEQIKNELMSLSTHEDNLLKTVFKKSVDICKRRYYKPTITPDSHMEFYRNSKKIFDNRQLYALKEVYLWRDKIAREEDESYFYVLPHHMLLEICESLPREMQGILACCNPIPPLVRQHMFFLHQIVLKARGQSLIKPIIEDETVNRVPLTTVNKYANKLYCPHDFSQLLEFRDDLPTLISSPPKSIDFNDTVIPKIGIYNQEVRSDNQVVNVNLENGKKIQFVSPYDRFKAVLPMIEKERLEEAARLQAINHKKLLCPIKQESNIPLTPVNATLKTEPDEIQDLPIKKTLKRKKKDQHQNDESSNAKIKPDPNDTDILKFNQLKNAKNSDKKPPVEIVESSSATVSTTKVDQFNRKRRHQGKSAQSSNQPVKFDYKNVDFKKFQGGAQRARGTEIKGKFHGKGSNKATNKSFNKLFTFSNVNHKKK